MKPKTKQSERQAAKAAADVAVQTPQDKSADGQSSSPANTNLESLHPDDWDFRWVNDTNLHDVINWEYYREAYPELSLPPARHLPASHSLFTPAKRSQRALHITTPDRFTLDSLTRFTTPQNCFVMSIDFSNHGVNEIIKEFADWAGQEHKRRKRTTRKHGRAAAPPWHQLKQLAAKRLQDQGLSHEQAKLLVAAVTSQSEKESPGDVLPNYASSGGWHDAVKAARQFLDGNPGAKFILDRIGRRRWWGMFSNAAQLAAALLKSRSHLLKPNPIQRSPGPAVSRLLCAQRLRQKKAASK